MRLEEFEWRIGKKNFKVAKNLFTFKKKIIEVCTHPLEEILFHLPYFRSFLTLRSSFHFSLFSRSSHVYLRFHQENENSISMRWWHEWVDLKKGMRKIKLSHNYFNVVFSSRIMLHIISRLYSSFFHKNSRKQIF